jgi:hypothetical protein
MKREYPKKTLVLVAGLVLVAACEPAPLPEDELYEPAVLIPACQPNNDGVIEAHEMPFVSGVQARYRIAEGDLDVDVKGRVGDDGVRVWDFSRPDPETEPVAMLGATSPVGWWFADTFPGADLVGPLEPGGAFQTPITIDDDGVRALGFASSEADPQVGTTLAVYDDPVLLYPFPLEEGTRVQSTTRANDAELYGLPVAFDDSYDVEVTSRGTLRLPHLILENTLRLTLRFERTLVVGDTRSVTHVFLHECLGEVARVSSQSVPLAEDIPDEFETASQIRRLSL